MAMSKYAYMRYFTKSDFIAHELNESILDFPKEGLCPSIWMNDGNEFVLTPKAKASIFAVVNWIQQRFKIPNMGANLAGSITSNSYGDDSDLDIHFNSENVKKDKVDEFNKLLRSAFDEEFKRDFPDLSIVDGHPIEVYFQKNVFQDLMSVGCYDIVNQQWLVGPELNDLDFDPYSEYYTADMRHVDDIIDDIRSVMMEAYEKSLILLKTKDAKFRHTIEKQFMRSTTKAAKLFTKLRKHRTLLSSPKNADDAMKKRLSKEWKIADSSFKLLDKFGYTAILKTITTCFENKDAEDFDIVEAAMSIVKAVNDNLSMQKIDDSEPLDESILGGVARYGLLASMLAIPGILPAKQVQMGLQSISAHKQLKQNSKDFQNMMTDLMQDETMYGTRENAKLPAGKMINALGWSIVREAEDQVKKCGGSPLPLEAIASIIWNRAGGDPNKFIDIISKNAQFSEWNNYKGGWTNDSYAMRYPKNLSNPNVATIWNSATNIAVDMTMGQFKSVIGNCNMIANPSRDGLGALKQWGYACDLQLKDHFFGYQPDQDGWRKAGKAAPMSDEDISDDPNLVFWSKCNYQVQQGDTLSSIAKKYNTTTDMITLVNAGLIDVLKAGQTIAVPFKVNKAQFAAQAVTRKAISKQIAQAKAAKKAKIASKAKTKTSSTVATTTTTQKKLGTDNKIVIVKPGDSLSKIAKANSTTVSSILKKNKSLKINSILQPGQSIYV